MPPKRRRLGASVANPINLTGFTPLVSLLGDAQSFPTGALIDSQYRSRRAKKWWRVAIDAVRMMVRNLDPRIWVLNWSRGIRAPQIEIGNPGFDQWKANSTSLGGRIILFLMIINCLGFQVGNPFFTINYSFLPD